MAMEPISFFLLIVKCPCVATGNKNYINPCTRIIQLCKTYVKLNSNIALKFGSYQFHHPHCNRQVANAQWIFEPISEELNWWSLLYINLWLPKIIWMWIYISGISSLWKQSPSLFIHSSRLWCLSSESTHRSDYLLGPCENYQDIYNRKCAHLKWT